MPELILTGTKVDPEMVLAVMLYPNDDVKQFQYMSMRLANLRDLAGDPEDLHFIYSKALWDAPSRAEVERLGSARTKRAMNAGGVVFIIRREHDLYLPEPSINSALMTWSDFLRSGGKMYRDGETIKRSSKSLIRRDFNEFRSVAHLWAAAVYFAYEHPAGSVGIVKPHDAMFENLEFFLAVSEDYREFGESWAAARSKDPVPVLNESETWKVPKSDCPYTLPHVDLVYGESSSDD